MSNHIWRAASGAVSLWEPASEVAITQTADVQGVLTSSYDCVKQERILPSSLYTQLKEFAHTPTRDDSELPHVRPQSPEKGSNSIDSQSTPCLTRLIVKNTSRRRSATSAISNDSRKIRQKLKFKMESPSDHSTPKLKGLSNLQSLEVLKNLERAPYHLWDEDERTLLTILYRWYDSTDPSIIPKVFNRITGLNLRPSTVRYQFENHVVLYGGLAYPEYARVMAVPFYDHEGRYEDIHAIIEQTAAKLGLMSQLQRREVEVKFNSGMARYAKSPRTRRTYRALVRRAAEKEREKARVAYRANPSVQLAVPQHPLPIHEHLTGHMALAVGPEDEAEEEWIDVEDLAVYHRQKLIETEPSITFRVWDSQSRTKFSEETGFTSEAFSIWRGQYPPPFSPDGQGKQALMVLTNLHLCLKGGASTFVSLSTSLLQALVKASAMDNPRIAVVALDHPLLNAPNKTLSAADILQMLKAEGQAWWAKYKGHAERMAWASVPAPTILSHFPISDLQTLADNDHSCSQILNLHEFRRGRRTRHVSSSMQEKNNVVNATTARAMASIARAFSMHLDGVSLTHIQGLVAAIVNSFHLLHTSSAHDASIAFDFASKLRSRTHPARDVASAFLNGVEKGNETIAYYARFRLPRSNGRNYRE